jgi:tetratricopeptide (TPR) repeat protein
MVLYLVTLLLYLRYENDGRRRWYIFAVSAFLLALLSKTSVVMLPFVLLGCAWWQRGVIVRKDVAISIPFFALSGLLGLVTVWFQYNTIGEHIVRTDGFFARLAGAGWAVWFYLYKAIIPYKLSFVYPRWEIGAASIVSYLPLISLLGCFAVFWWYRKSWGKACLFGVGYYVVTLFPVLGFFNIYFMKYSLVADHWQYVSIIGIIALVVGLGNYLRSQCNMALRKLLSVAAVSLVCLFCILTWRQENIYRDIETLWRDTISKNPRAWIAHNNLGVVLKQQGRFDEAIAHYSEVLMIKPHDEAAHSNLGLALYEQGKLDEAVGHYRKALQIKPDYAEAHYNMGLAYVKQSKLDEAIGHFSMALQIRPDYAEAYTYIGIASYQQGKPDEAIDYYHKALQIKPEYAGAHSNLGIAFASKGRLEEAMHHFSEAIRIRPDFAEAHHNFGLALSGQGRVEEAIYHFSQALRIKPDHVDAHYNLGLALAKKGKLEQAMRHFSEAVRIEPGRAELHYSFGLALALRGSGEEAIPYFSRAVKIKPDFAEAHLNLGAVLGQLSRTDEAIRHFSEALHIRPDFTEAKQHLTRALKEAGKPEGISNTVTGQ